MNIYDTKFTFDAKKGHAECDNYINIRKQKQKRKNEIAATLLKPSHLTARVNLKQ